ncbi:hypothetical protein TELCIR_22974, partial [Teladorsagia circumcincta]
DIRKCTTTEEGPCEMVVRGRKLACLSGGPGLISGTELWTGSCSPYSEYNGHALIYCALEGDYDKFIKNK